MNWEKIKLIIKPKKSLFWGKTYCMLPTPIRIKRNIFRIFYSSRNKKNQSFIGFSDIDFSKNFKIVNYSKKPVLSPGVLGSFDDNGVTPSSIVRKNSKLFLYYVGWKPRSTTRYSLVSGLAISNDNGKTFKRFSKAPILNLSNREPYSILTAPWVIKQKGIWKMWYVSGEVWLNPDLPRYNIKYAYSKNGMNWIQTGKVCIKIKKNERAIARPCVFYENKTYYMIYSYETFKQKYRIGFAKSKDGLNWKRDDKKFNFKVSSKGWDSEMIEYGVIVKYKNNTFMLYNGNKYGMDGIGIAIKKKILCS